MFSSLPIPSQYNPAVGPPGPLYEGPFKHNSLSVSVPVGGGGAAARHDPVNSAVLHLQDVAPLAAVLERRPHPVGGAHPQLRTDHRGPVQALRAANFDGKETELGRVASYNY